MVVGRRLLDVETLVVKLVVNHANALHGTFHAGRSDALKLVTQEGLEPPTPSSEDWCSIH
jgi:hypothetical protein